jgi:Concanavalin A-like lectin/glucanases superfamily
VYDAAFGTAKLYVNGVLAAARTGVSGWQANGSLTVGTGLLNGQRTATLPGLVGQVQAWQGVLASREVQDLFQHQGA